MRRWGFRTRLTLWHAAATTIVLVTVAVLADWYLTRSVMAQLDSALAAVAETEAGSAMDSSAGIHLHDVDLLADTGPRRIDKLDKFVQIVDGRGAVLLRSRTLGTATLPVSEAVVASVGRGETVVETSQLADGEPVRLLTLPLRTDGAYPYAVQIGAPLRPTYAVMRSARVLIWAGSALVLVVVISTGALLARRALRPVADIASKAQDIGQDIGGRRLPHPGTDDEIGQLVSTLNEMLARLEQTMDAHRRFTADAAHELRSPLSRLRSEMEIALRQTRTAEEYQSVIGSGLDEAVRMTDLTVALLTLARLDAGEVPSVPGADVGVTTAAFAAATARLEDEARRQGVDIVLEPSTRLEVAVPSGLLMLLVDNLLQNAIKFSPSGGTVRAAAAGRDGEAVVSISDQGPGVPPEHAARIFDRFYRADPARSAAVPGAGLGLSICRAIVDRYRGALEIAPNPGGGSTFTVRLPLAPARQGPAPS